MSAAIGAIDHYLILFRTCSCIFLYWETTITLQSTKSLDLIALSHLGFLGGAAMGLFVGSQEVMSFPEGATTKQKVPSLHSLLSLSLSLLFLTVLFP
jgi:hypothetical protein